MLGTCIPGDSNNAAELRADRILFIRPPNLEPLGHPPNIHRNPNPHHPRPSLHPLRAQHPQAPLHLPHSPLPRLPIPPFPPPPHHAPHHALPQPRLFPIPPLLHNIPPAPGRPLDPYQSRRRQFHLNPPLCLDFWVKKETKKYQIQYVENGQKFDHDFGILFSDFAWQIVGPELDRWNLAFALLVG